MAPPGGSSRRAAATASVARRSSTSRSSSRSRAARYSADSPGNLMPIEPPPVFGSVEPALLDLRLPGPASVDFELQGDTEERPDEHDERQDARALEGWVNGDRPDDVGRDQELEPEEDRPPQALAVGPVDGIELVGAQRAGDEHRRRNDEPERHDRDPDRVDDLADSVDPVLEVRVTHVHMAILGPSAAAPW